MTTTSLARCESRKPHNLFAPGCPSDEVVPHTTNWIDPRASSCNLGRDRAA